MPTLRIGRRSLASLPPVTKLTIFFDEDLAGFGVRVSPTGAKTWIVEYRPGAGGRRVAKRRLGLGKAASEPGTGALTPEDARKAAAIVLAEVRLGNDPAKQRRISREAPRVDELAERYKVETATGRKASSLALYETYWRLHILPRLGKMHARSVTRNDVAKAHRAIGEEHQATANRCVVLLAHFFSWAEDAGELPEGFANPARRIAKFKEQSRERYLSIEELARVGDAIALAERHGLEFKIDPAKKTKHAPKTRTASKIGAHAAGALRLLILTGARLREILHLEWANVDLVRGLLTLPDSKTGKKVILLNAPALEVLAGLPRIGRYVIAGDSAGQEDERPRADLQRPWAAVCRAAGLSRVRLHDLRHTHAATGAGAGLGLLAIGKLLGHADPATTSRYAHFDADPLRRASETIGAALASAMAGRPSAQIVPTRRESTT